MILNVNFNSCRRRRHAGKTLCGGDMVCWCGCGIHMIIAMDNNNEAYDGHHQKNTNSIVCNVVSVFWDR